MMQNDGSTAKHGEIEGLRVLVTGGGTGIGLAIAEALLREGAKVCISGRNADTLAAAKARLETAGGDLSTVAFSVTDRESCFQAIEAISADWGGVDALVNNAGMYRDGLFMDLQPEHFEDLFRTNVVGVVNLMQAVLPQMIARKSGRIVNIASTAGKWGSVNQSAYNTSKHALVGLTRCAALEMAGYGITVNAICPGLVETSMAQTLIEGQARRAGTDASRIRDQLTKSRIPIGRLVDPAEIGGLVVYLLSARSGGMTGQSLLYDGGMLQI